MSQPDMDSGTSGHVEFEYNDTDFSHADEKKNQSRHIQMAALFFSGKFSLISLCVFSSSAPLTMFS